MRIARTALGAAVLGSLLFSGASAFGATAPAGGTINVFATPVGMGAKGTIVVTGAIGDFGKTLTINQNGTTNANGNYVKITLKKGAFEVNSTALNAAANKLQPTNNSTTCSASGSVTGPVTLFNGTGLYQGIAGTVNITETFAFIGPLYKSGPKKGQCNESNNAKALAQYGSITGTGTVTFG